MYQLHIGNCDANENEQKKKKNTPNVESPEIIDCVGPRLVGLIHAIRRLRCAVLLFVHITNPYLHCRCCTSQHCSSSHFGALTMLLTAIEAHSGRQCYGMPFVVVRECFTPCSWCDTTAHLKHASRIGWLENCIYIDLRLYELMPCIVVLLLFCSHLQNVRTIDSCQTVHKVVTEDQITTSEACACVYYFVCE